LRNARLRSRIASSICASPGNPEPADLIGIDVIGAAVVGGGRDDIDFLPTGYFFLDDAPQRGAQPKTDRHCRVGPGSFTPSRSQIRTWLTPNVGDLPPSLHGHYPVSSLLRSSPPLPAASVLSASQFRCLYLFPWHRRTGSQVPYESPNESHASYTPGTAWPVGRFPPHSSWSSSATPVLMPPKAFRCVTRGSLALISLIHT